MGLAAEGYKPDLNTDTAALYILQRQHANGEWPAQHADGRPPICLDYIGQTARAMRALQLYTPRPTPKNIASRFALQQTGLRTRAPTTTKTAAGALPALHGREPTEPQPSRPCKELLAAQHPDGGWSDLPTMQSTAYATGKSLVALHLAGVPASSPAYQRGIKCC